MGIAQLQNAQTDPRARRADEKSYPSFTLTGTTFRAEHASRAAVRHRAIVVLAFAVALRTPTGNSGNGTRTQTSSTLLAENATGAVRHCASVDLAGSTALKTGDRRWRNRLESYRGAAIGTIVPVICQVRIAGRTFHHETPSENDHINLWQMREPIEQVHCSVDFSPRENLLANQQISNSSWT